MMKKKITGYSKYSLDVKKRTKINILKDTYLPLPKKKYQIIYVDPPWYYNGKLQFDKSSKGKDKIDIKKKYFYKHSFIQISNLENRRIKKVRCGVYFGQKQFAFYVDIKSTSRPSYRAW